MGIAWRTSRKQSQADPQGMVKGLSNKAKKEIADELNRMELSGYGDYERFSKERPGMLV